MDAKWRLRPFEAVIVLRIFPARLTVIGSAESALPQMWISRPCCNHVVADQIGKNRVGDRMQGAREREIKIERAVREHRLFNNIEIKNGPEAHGWSVNAPQFFNRSSIPERHCDAVYSPSIVRRTETSIRLESWTVEVSKIS